MLISPNVEFYQLIEHPLRELDQPSIVWWSWPVISAFLRAIAERPETVLTQNA